MNFYYDCKVNFTDKNCTPEWKSSEAYSFTNEATENTAKEIGETKAKELFVSEFGNDLIFIDSIEIDFYETSDDARP